MRNIYVFSSTVALISLSLFMAAACSNSNPTSSEMSEAVLMPLATGNTWLYQTQLFISGNPVEGLTDSTGSRIIGQTQVSFEGQTFGVGIQEFFDPASGRAREAKWLNWNGEDGLYSLGGISIGDTLVRKALRRKFPAKVGESWRVPNLVYDLFERKFAIKDTLTFTCVSTDTPFVTLADTFQHCYVYHHKRSQGDDILLLEDVFDYYAPNYGFVGQEVKTEGILKTRALLYDFKINSE